MLHTVCVPAYLHRQFLAVPLVSARTCNTSHPALAVAYPLKECLAVCGTHSEVHYRVNKSLPPVHNREPDESSPQPQTPTPCYD
jgi:hypothetical protein